MGRAGRSRLVLVGAVVAALALAALLLLGSAGLGPFSSGGSGPGSAPAAGAPDALGAGTPADGRDAPHGATLAASAAPDAPTARRRIVGRVIDREGKPVAGARVAAVDAIREDGPRVSDDDPSLPTTGADGRFDLAPPSPTVSFRVLAIAPGRGHALARGVRLDDPADLVLVEGATLSGRVVGPRGEPIPGARATIVGTIESGAIESSVVADRHGRFEARGLPPEIEVRVDAADRFSVARRVKFESRAMVEETFVLGRGATLRGLVIDAKAKTPVAGATVYSVVCPTNDDAALRPGLPHLAASATNEKGRFVLERVPTARAKPDECLSVVVEAEGYAPVVTRPEMPSEGGVRALEIALRNRTFVLEVRVVDEHGRAVAGAAVTAEIEHDVLIWREGVPPESRTGVTRIDAGVTDGEGRRRIGPLATVGSGSPTLTIVAAHDGRTGREPVPTATPPSSVTVRLADVEGLRPVEGDVMDVRGVAIPGASVILDTGFRNLGYGSEVAGRTDEAGHFRVFVRAEEAAAFTLGAWRPGYVARRLALADVPVGETMHLVLDACTVVTGRVLGADGRPWPGAELMWGPAAGPDGVSPCSGTVRADADGRFRIEDAPARVMLVALALGGSEEDEAVEMRDVPTDRPIEIRFAESWKEPPPETPEPAPPPTAREVVVSVLRPEGDAPVDSALGAWLLLPDARDWTEGEETGYGRVRFEKVPFGTYRLWVSGTGIPTHHMTVEVPFGTEPLDVRITVARGATVVVSVESDEPLDARDVTMALVPRGLAVDRGFQDSRRECDRVEFRGVAAGEYWLDASVLGRPEWIVAAPSEVVVANDRDLRTSIRLVRGGEVHFVFVETGVTGGKKDGRAWWTWPARTAILTDASGREWWFRVNVDGRSLWEEDAPRDRRLEREAAPVRLPPGDYRAHLEGFDASTGRAFSVRHGETTPVVLEVPQAR